MARNAAQMRIYIDSQREDGRRSYHEKRRVLKMDPVAYKAFKDTKAAYMREYRAKRNAKNAAVRDGDAVQQVQPSEDEAGVLPEVPVPGVPGPG
jgi:hypothetical protein